MTEVVLDILQWGGAALVVLGYVALGRGDVRPGALATALAAMLLIAWSVATGNWGILALNVVVGLVQVWTMARRARPRGEDVLDMRLLRRWR